MSLFRSSQAVGLHRFWVMPAEAVHVLAGFVMVCPLFRFSKSQAKSMTCAFTENDADSMRSEAAEAVA